LGESPMLVIALNWINITMWLLKMTPQL